MSPHSHHQGAAVAAHGHGHAHGTQHTTRRQLTITLCLVVGYMVAEFVGGLLSNSLALLADSGHMLSDAAALGLSVFAVWIAQRPPTARRTYGYYRAEILAALANAATLIAVSILVLIEAYRRFRAPPEVQGFMMLAIAFGGLAVNVASLWILRGGKSENLNVRGAWLHVLTDALGSVGTIVAAALIWSFGWSWADPVASVIVSVLIIYSAWDLLAESVSILMESAPRGIDVDQVRETLCGTSGVAAVHDLHVWCITSRMAALSVHLVTAGPQPGDLLPRVRNVLHARFGIDHATIQLEDLGPHGNHCGTACE